MEAGLSGGASDQSLMCEITVEIVCNLKNDLSVEGPYLNLNGGKSPVNKFGTFFFLRKFERKMFVQRLGERCYFGMRRLTGRAWYFYLVYTYNQLPKGNKDKGSKGLQNFVRC